MSFIETERRLNLSTVKSNEKPDLPSPIHYMILVSHPSYTLQPLPLLPLPTTLSTLSEECVDLIPIDKWWLKSKSPKHCRVTPQSVLLYNRNLGHTNESDNIKESSYSLLLLSSLLSRPSFNFLHNSYENKRITSSEL